MNKQQTVIDDLHRFASRSLLPCLFHLTVLRYAPDSRVESLKRVKCSMKTLE